MPCYHVVPCRSRATFAAPPLAISVCAAQLLSMATRSVAHDPPSTTSTFASPSPRCCSLIVGTTSATLYAALTDRHDLFELALILEPDAPASPAASLSPAATAPVGTRAAASDSDSCSGDGEPREPPVLRCTVAYNALPAVGGSERSAAAREESRFAAKLAAGAAEGRSEHWLRRQLATYNEAFLTRVVQHARRGCGGGGGGAGCNNGDGGMSTEEADDPYEAEITRRCENTPSLLPFPPLPPHTHARSTPVRLPHAHAGHGRPIAVALR